MNNRKRSRLTMPVTERGDTYAGSFTIGIRA